MLWQVYVQDLAGMEGKKKKANEKPNFGVAWKIPHALDLLF